MVVNRFYDWKITPTEFYNYDALLFTSISSKLLLISSAIFLLNVDISEELTKI